MSQSGGFINLQKSWASLWKRAAKATRQHYRDALTRERRWEYLATRAPSSTVSKQLDKATLELETTHLVIKGMQKELQYLLDEDLIRTPIGIRIAQHTLKRWRYDNMQ